MREFMEAFRLPGESQQINRITETFAEVYFAADPGKTRSSSGFHYITYNFHSGSQIARRYLRPGLLNYHVEY